MRRALYRTHRPTDFTDVVGQDHVVDLLRRALETGSIGHAYLFTGPRGTGKTTVARLMAYGITGLEYAGDRLPVDIIEMDAASNRGIDDIRDLRDKVVLAPLQAAKKVYIIDEVHMLTKEGFNALLKTLEEPPEHAVFILATTDVHKVPATILSRTQRYHFRLAPRETLVTRLRRIAELEGIAADDAALEMIAELGAGSFRDSISLLDQLSSGGQSVTAELVAATLGVPTQTEVEAIIAAVAGGDASGALRHIARLKDQGIAAEVIAQKCTEVCLKEGEKVPRLYRLAAEIMRIPSHMPLGLALSAVIAAAASEHEPTKSASLVAERPMVVAEKKIMDKLAEPVAKAKLPAAEITTPQTEKPGPAEITREKTKPKKPASVKAIDFSWPQVLAAAQHHPLLSSVLQRAEAEFAGNTLTISFTYALHRRKMETAKYRQQLCDLLEELYAAPIELILRDAEPKEVSPELAAVQALMGGGEVV